MFMHVHMYLCIHECCLLQSDVCHNKLVECMMCVEIDFLSPVGLCTPDCTCRQLTAAIMSQLVSLLMCELLYTEHLDSSQLRSARMVVNSNLHHTKPCAQISEFSSCTMYAVC